MPRLVRRTPVLERIKAYLDPSDWLIWIAEELNSSDWEDCASTYSLYLGFSANFLFILAQANSGASSTSEDDGVFNTVQGPGWLKWFANLVVLVLMGTSFGNAWLVWGKRRHYRLFEQSVEKAPRTPSAKRVRVDSSPASASPMAFVRNLVTNSAASRAHPDEHRDVWEIAVWDPNPLCLQLFCLFSPLHVLLYYFNLPVPQLDPRPSVKLTTTIVIGLVLSLQMWWLRRSFIQQTKDNAIISREVLHEYDSKFVHPSLQKPCRDVAIQTISKRPYKDSSVGVRGTSDGLASEITTYTPKTVINRTFRTNPNANYVNQYDPDNASTTSIARSTQNTPRASYHSTTASAAASSSAVPDFSPIRQSQPPNPFHQAPPMPRTAPNNDGGYLGVKMHAASPLRKSASANFFRDAEGSRIASRGRESLGGAGERRVREREGSPLKRASTPVGDGLGQGEGRRLFGKGDRSGGYEGLGVGRRESSRFD
ncbi:hypothetical protein IAQ61_002350 [Plenodomus lingam]|uniref:Uncharacterized protein n=1 Tax=Leptosphaeria maculans (strain JN3 / isolate v23.1.3 / race Av1-4-5-6-7-8) TaxID=985895 RepID=E4ZHP6_LEPMJ|nr:hypothetical protein LEMA_P059130.1 [Plenodomus lingam JN3]KAH9876989.1 hypothetical protein IAQ61_002350 [Plenodomus lingam]CBX90879.1 hypothetical protein LEMA_P059130.1 [Plenodomus lingam JN3]